MLVQPYLFFDGRCQEAVEFYQAALGAKVEMLMRNKESPDPEMCMPGAEEQILHCNLRIGETTVFLSDGRCPDQQGFQGFSLSVTVDSEEEARQIFGALAEGGQVQMDLTKTFFSPLFGMAADRFGVLWMVMVAEMK